MVKVVLKWKNIYFSCDQLCSERRSNCLYEEIKIYPFWMDHYVVGVVVKLKFVFFTTTIWRSECSGNRELIFFLGDHGSVIEVLKWNFIFFYDGLAVVNVVLEFIFLFSFMTMAMCTLSELELISITLSLSRCSKRSRSNDVIANVTFKNGKWIHKGACPFLVVSE